MGFFSAQASNFSTPGGLCSYEEVDSECFNDGPDGPAHTGYHLDNLVWLTVNVV